MAMHLTKLGHACLHITDGDASVLIDPGSWSSGFEELRGLSAILITHQHADHLDMDRIGALVEANPQAFVVADWQSVNELSGAGITARVATAGDSFDAGGLSVRVFGEHHALIHADIPIVSNVGYLVGGTVFHPGDSFTQPHIPVPVLALPTGAPWLKAGESIDFLRAVGPLVAVPI
ncbi:MAG: MBL fold metallo-hydrolase, partial [Pseudonocardiales bacterium]|nr:MBL fold metallo-hydrolase [Pseudonocardiales bacterium]